MINLYNKDCIEFMKGIEDQHYDLAIVDPPYFEKGGTHSYYNSGLGTTKRKDIIDTWFIPDQKYFDQLYRVSKKQIIWGCNYYAKYIPHKSRIVWDKISDGTPFSQCDLASYSEGLKIYQFRYKWNGMIQQDMKNKEIRIHPTQKPVQLYKWLLKNYAKPNDKILDTHGGSASIAIACHDMKFDLDLCELDSDYFQAAKERLEKHQQQLSFF